MACRFHNLRAASCQDMLSGFWLLPPSTSLTPCDVQTVGNADSREVADEWYQPFPEGLHGLGGSMGAAADKGLKSRVERRRGPEIVLVVNTLGMRTVNSLYLCDGRGGPI